MLTGMFRDRESTEGAYQSLRDRGYTDDDINVLMSDETRDKYYSDGDSVLEDNKALEGAGTGGAIGGTLGAIIGGIAAIGTNVLLPGLGLVVVGFHAGLVLVAWVPPEGPYPCSAPLAEPTGSSGCRGHAPHCPRMPITVVAWPCRAARRHGHARTVPGVRSQSCAWPWHPRGSLPRERWAEPTLLARPP